MIKLTVATTFQQLPVWICNNTKEGETLPCDGFAWKNHVMNQ